MSSWAGPIAAITLFVEDLELSKGFYSDVFELPLHFEDPHSAVFKFGDTLINLLTISQAPELIGPATVGVRDAGARMQFTLHVADVDQLVARLEARGVRFVNGPLDRPWGPRTACFADPSGHLWEIAS
jgi:catechol 2,3-dioxygenase-like lactoylglutathione lyase family enzyme